MKQLILSVTVIFFALTSIQAQSKKELKAMLERDLEAYKRYTMSMNFDSSFQFMPPKMFEIIPRDSLLANALKTFGDEEMSIEMKGMDFKSKGKLKIKKAKPYHWAFVPYDLKMRIVLKGDQAYKTNVAKMMKAEFGSENVQEDGESALLITERNKRIIAFKDPASPIWSFLEDKRKKAGDQEKELLFYRVIPIEVQEAARKQ